MGDEEETADVVVPNSVINEDSGGKFVYVINAEYGSFGNKYFAKKTSVKVGKSDSSNSIIEEGINKNDYIVVTSNKNLEEGQRVKIANEDDYN